MTPMRFNTIINRYILLELFPPFIVNLFFFTFIFLMTRILDITHLVVNYRLSLWSVVLMLGYTMPYFLQFVLPMSVMMAVLLTFLRLSSDNEIIALKSSGVSLYGLLPPVLVFCLMGFAVTAFMGIYGLPKGRLAAKALAINVVASNLDIGLKERTFNDRFEGVMVYINKIDLQKKVLIDVFVEDQRTENIVNTVVAPRGKLFSDPDNFVVHLRLFDGTINQVNLEKRAANTIFFETYDMNIKLKQAVAGATGGPKDEEEMTLGELRRFAREYPKRDDRYWLAVMEFHKKFSIPFACFALGVLAMPLGIQSRSAKRSFGIGLGLFFFLLYYILLSAGWVFGEAGVYHPLIGMWVPNIVMGGIGIYLLLRTARERSMHLDVIIDGYLHLVARIRSKVRKGD
jgi:lipopolysaccharide export system permease protein